MPGNYQISLVTEGVSLTVSIDIKSRTLQHESVSTLVPNVFLTSAPNNQMQYPQATGNSETPSSAHFISCITPSPIPSKSSAFLSPSGVVLVALLTAAIVLYFFNYKRHKQQEPQIHENRVAVNVASGGGDPSGSTVSKKEDLALNTTTIPSNKVRSSSSPITIDVAFSTASEKVESDNNLSTNISVSSGRVSPANDEVTIIEHSPRCAISRCTSFGSVEDAGSIVGEGSSATEGAIPQFVPPELVLLPGRDEKVHPKIAKLVVEGTLTKSAIRKMKPMKPNARLVNNGYNPKLDERRPQNMKDYLRDYRVLFVIDDSGSMYGTPWTEARDSLFEIAEYALKYHFETVDIMFLNNSMRESGVKGTQEVLQMFNSAFPGGGTPLGAVLRRVLQEQIERLDIALRNGNYKTEAPLDVIVITDGVPDPSPTPASVIEHAANELKSKRHHQNALGIQFVQIGNDPQAAPTLHSLIHGNNNDMVDTVSYSMYKGEDGGKLTPAVLERIVLGALHPNLRSYYNRWESISTTVV